jgi:hypothetical protein
LVAAGGTLTLNKDVTGSGAAHISGGTLVAAGAFSENVQFTGSSGTLALAHAQAYAGKVSGFSHTGTTSLDLQDIGFVSASEATFAGTTAGGTLTVTDGTHTAKIKLVGNYTGASFTASSDGHGGTVIVDPTPSAPHFVAAIAAHGARGGASLLAPAIGPSRTQVLLASGR